ncbi:MAG: ribonuclease E/G [Alphaproteobacteria bacterium]|nr:ribonuclease E/G [Alphaproteobacteria bacterium]
MLIDATHPEETRVTVVSGNRLEEFDYETTTKQQIKGNIYLAKVTRVEPSLQAAFVEYGGNRHGFLAFSEIHPDYYRIPVSDREELVEDVDADEDDVNGEAGDGVEDMGAGEGVDEAVEEAARRRPRLRRQYKIQEVIKRRQVMLVQVVKEERGTKGAALTTYLSLAGRYCVVMPNTSRGGGVSRKIANVQDRKRLKSILSELSVPEGMAVILRTAGAERSKAEVKRDFDYIMRLWDEIRERTLESTAPSLIHEEGSLVKRAIRDLYTKDIEEVLVAGDEGYRVAKDFMRALIPSHAKKVQPYKDEQGIPLFHRYQVEQQLALIHDSTVHLRSGGSIVIHQTEALVAIDVNSGKATRERHIEETALKTNLEAAEEVARQLRLRDLAGLIVIDFIDMDENRNDHAVERRLKEALRRDRARIQVGRISAFGLLEMSRQRLRPSLLEAMSQSCPTCGGVGYIVSTESAALMVTRALEEEGLRRRASEITVKVPGSVALYILNHKRAALTDMESRYGFTVTIEAVDGMLPPNFEIQRSGTIEGEGGEQTAQTEDNRERNRGGDSDEDRGSRRRGRRGGRRRGRSRDDEDQNIQDAEEVEDESEAEESAEGDQQSDGEGGSGDDRGRRRRKRGRRGGRRRGRNRNEDGTQESGEGGEEQSADSEGDAGQTDDNAADEGGEETKPKRRRRSRGRRRDAQSEDSQSDDVQSGEAQSGEAGDDGDTDVAATETVTETGEETAEAKSPEAVEPSSDKADASDEPAEEKPAEAKAKRPRRSRKKAAAAKPAAAEAVDAVVSDPEAAKAESEEKPKRPRRSRKKAAAAKPEPAEPAEQVDVPAAANSDAPSESPEPSPEPAPEPPKPEAAPSDDSAEPAAEESSDAAEAGNDDTPSQPKKRGWWNRVLG